MQDAPYKTIPLRDRSGNVRAEAKVDAENYAHLSLHAWHITRGYARRHVPRPGVGTIAMAREIMGLAPGDERVIDHINRDRLDNRRSNLRIVTRAVNGRNVPSRKGTSQYRGVCWDRALSKWRAYACFERRACHLGVYRLEGDAARAVNAFWVERGYAAPNEGI